MADRRALPRARGRDLRPQPSAASRAVASATCCWCSRARGRWRWRASISRSSATRAEPGGSRARRAGCCPVTPETPADPGILELARPYHEAAERYLDRPVAEVRVALSGARGRFEDSALVDAIHEVQLHYAGAQVSFASLFQTRVEVPRGPVTLRELAALYLYDNELYAIEGNGRMVREALENAARYFRTCPEPSCASGPLVERTVMGFNYDMAQGVEYEIDLTRPVGARVAQPALPRRAAAGRRAAADRDQQLPGGGLGRLHDVPRREDRLAQRPRDPRPDGRLLERARAPAREARRQLASRCRRAPSRRSRARRARGTDDATRGARQAARGREPRARPRRRRVVRRRADRRPKASRCASS